MIDLYCRCRRRLPTVLALTALLMLTTSVVASMATSQPGKADEDKAERRQTAEELKKLYEKTVIGGAEACSANDATSSDVCEDYKKSLNAIEHESLDQADAEISALEWDVKNALKAHETQASQSKSGAITPGDQGAGGAGPTEPGNENGKPGADDSEGDHDGTPTAEDSDPDQDGTPTAEDSEPDTDGTPTSEDSDPQGGDGGSGGGGGDCDPDALAGNLEKTNPCN